MVEKTICGSEALRAKDCFLKYAYFDALNAAKTSCDQEQITVSQRNWIRNRSEKCGSGSNVADCLNESYAIRGRELISTYKLQSDVYNIDDFASRAR